MRKYIFIKKNDAYDQFLSYTRFGLVRCGAPDRCPNFGVEPVFKDKKFQASDSSIGVRILSVMFVPTRGHNVFWLLVC